MAYQYVREPLRDEEADQLCQVCETLQEKLIIWTLLDTGLRVSELCALTPQHILWQQKSLRITGKGGPHGKKSKKRVVPMSKPSVPGQVRQKFGITKYMRAVRKPISCQQQPSVKMIAA